MADCPKCHAPLHLDGNKLICSCGYQRSIPEHVPSQAELLEENEKLKEENKILKDKIGQLRIRIAAAEVRLRENDSEKG